jgi:tetratricopeptide (TPR) repeat protein
MIRESSHRLALMVCLVLASSAGLVVPSFAQGLAVQSGKIAELSRAGKSNEAIPLAQAMVANLDKGQPSRDLGAALNNLAQLYGDVGRDVEAEPLYKRALAIIEKTVGLDSVDIAPELNNLAALYQRQLRYVEAEPLFKRALTIREKSLPAGHPDIGQSLNNLAL